VRLWDNAWAEFVPFLAFDTEIRKVVCSTNAIESVLTEGASWRGLLVCAIDGTILTVPDTVGGARRTDRDRAVRTGGELS
jgi:hypothetical protein